MADQDNTTTKLPGMDTLDVGYLLRTLVAIKKGDFSVRMPVDQTSIGYNRTKVQKVAQEF